MSDPTAAIKRKPSVLLIVSLCLNVALIGLAAVMLMRTGLRGFETHEPKGGLSAQVLMRMAPAEKDKIQAIVDTHRARAHELRQASMQAREELFGALSAANFDRQAFDKSLASVAAADAALQAETMKVTSESVAVLTPAERQSVAAQMPKPNRSWLRRMFRRR